MRKPAAIVAIALAAALVLGGCSSQPGVAAVVDGRTITIATVDRATRELGQLFPVEARGVLSMLIVTPVYLDEAQGLGLANSRDEARSFLADVATANEQTLDADAVSDATLDIIRFDMAVQQMNQIIEPGPLVDRINTRLAELDVDVNPRYGEYTGAAVMPSTPEWIVSAPTS